MKKMFLIFTLLGFSFAANAGEKMQDFTLKSNQGKNIRLSELRGQVVMLNFWASWCGPCVQEMPVLEKIYQRYSATGFVILGVNNDLTEEKAGEFLKERPVSFPIVYDPDLEVRNRFKEYSGMPVSIFVDCDGNINEIHRGYKKARGDDKKYIAKVKELIRACSA